MVTTDTPEVFFILKQRQDDKEQTIQAMEYPFQALGGLPQVGDLIKFEEGTYRVYLRNYDYSNILILDAITKGKIKIYIYMIKVED